MFSVLSLKNLFCRDYEPQSPDSLFEIVFLRLFKDITAKMQHFRENLAVLLYRP